MILLSDLFQEKTSNKILKSTERKASALLKEWSFLQEAIVKGPEIRALSGNWEKNFQN